ncbi:MAG: hypothetical protein IPM96_21990 [Ignavibacteria bacterium]|nr:hypothetical protein [Ignavibacteria bacterium]
MKNYHLKNENEWIDFIGSIPDTEYSFIEYHAYEFSGRLLVPKDKLINSLRKAGDLVNSNSLLRNSNDFDSIKSYIYSNIGREFLVSYGVIERRINSEQINVKEIFEME